MTDKKDKIQNYIFDNEEHKRDEIICPYCKCKFWNDDFEFLYTEADCRKLKCEDCEKEFYLNSGFDWWYTTTPIEYEVEKILEEEDGD